MTFAPSQAAEHIARVWSDELIQELSDYIEIPALSPSFDPDWEANGHIQAAVDQIVDWIKDRPVAGMAVSVQTLPGLTPVIVVEIDAYNPTEQTDPAQQTSGDGNSESHAGDATESTVLLYGHLDKQPEMVGWRDDLGPWKPVRDGDRLYGRGGADDGYAAFASLTAIEAVQASGGSHSRCVLLVEASEESGSPDLPAHIDALRERLGEVSLVICLDSGCATFDTMWLTTSLRGVVVGTLGVDIVHEGLHSGSAGGVVPSSFRIQRQLLERIEDAATGDIRIDGANVEIPDYRLAEIAAVAAELGPNAMETIPFVDGAYSTTPDVAEMLLNRTWRPSLSVTGADGLPSTADAGNVLRPSTALKLSLRVPPTADEVEVLANAAEILTSDSPYGARVTFTDTECGPGWNAPALQPWLEQALEQASQETFDRSFQLVGEGGSIPFMGMLGEKFPDAQFVITGVLGPETNAHGPNEFLHVAYAEKLTCCIASVLDNESRR